MKGLLLIPVCLFAQAVNLLERADEAFREGNFTRAETLARQAVAGDPNAVHGHMILGVIAARRNQWEVSNSHFLAVVRLEPSNPHDANAIRIEWQGQMLGYVPRKDNSDLARQMDLGARPEGRITALSKAANGRHQISYEIAVPLK